MKLLISKKSSFISSSSPQETPTIRFYTPVLQRVRTALVPPPAANLRGDTPCECTTTPNGLPICKGLDRYDTSRTKAQAKSPCLNAQSQNRTRHINLCIVSGQVNLRHIKLNYTFILYPHVGIYDRYLCVIIHIFDPNLA